jgi:hypothetical protein
LAALWPTGPGRWISTRHYGALAFETDIDSDGLHVPHVVLEGNAGVPTTRYEFTQHALAQLMERLRIDIRTARYILQRSPREATELVNALLAKKGEETMLLRTFDGNGSNPVARSFLSPSYKILDHEDVLETMLPVLAESDGLGNPFAPVAVTSACCLVLNRARLQRTPAP